MIRYYSSGRTHQSVATASVSAGTVTDLVSVGGPPGLFGITKSDFESGDIVVWHTDGVFAGDANLATPAAIAVDTGVDWDPDLNDGGGALVATGSGGANAIVNIGKTHVAKAAEDEVVYVLLNSQLGL
ncbi:MAG: DUF2190 family protein [Planctomycetota bacterium]